MPVNALVLQAALAHAHGNNVSRRARFDAAVGLRHGIAVGFGPAVYHRDPMRDALDEYINAPTSCMTNRWADDIQGIDAAVRNLRATWHRSNAPSPAAEQAVEALLRACAAWLGGVRPYITSWRDAPVRRVYWKTAYLFACHLTRLQAHADVIANNMAGQATSAAAVAVAAYAAVPTLNPFSHADFTASAPPAGGAVGALLRGSRFSPAAVLANGGFVPQNLNNLDLYSPWFEGNALDDTTSATVQQQLAVNAHWQGGPTVVVNPPAWVPGLMAPADTFRGFVYEFGNLAGRQSVRVTSEPAGVEEIYLSVPHQCITRWWVVRWGDKRTIGPFVFPPAAMAPVVTPEGQALVPGTAGHSANPRRLHY